MHKDLQYAVLVILGNSPAMCRLVRNVQMDLQIHEL